MPSVYDEPPVLRVADALRVCNGLFADLDFAVEGEIAEFSVSKGKFVFFKLKDEEEEACLSCFMMAYQLGVPLEDGMRAVVQARAGIHPKSGQFRLTVSRVDIRGEGNLKRAFQLLLSKLEKEGLFAAEGKRALPAFPRRVGVISSSEAAGFGDFKKIAWSRLPGVAFVLANVAVQGKEAEAQICQAFDYLNTAYVLDAIVLIRGGGSLEDLHAFNSEPVARAIVRSKAPVIVGVGHERDVTIADYCADVRAATPSNAAQLLLPTKEEVRAVVARLTEQGRRLTERAIHLQRERCRSGLAGMRQQLAFALAGYRTKAASCLKTVEALSPQAVLARGYSLTCREDGHPIREASSLAPGDIVLTRFASGAARSSVINLQES